MLVLWRTVPPRPGRGGASPAGASRVCDSEDPWQTTPTRPTEPRTGYDAQDITVLEGLEAVRKRPGMYIGSTGVRGLHHLVYEVVDNSVDEALAGHCDAVDVTIHPDNSVTVVDNGRGIPVDTMEKEGKSGARGRADRAARRRQVRRRRRLQGLRRPARRRRLGGQRAVRGAPRRGPARRLHAGRRTTSRGVPQGDARSRASRRDETGTTITFLPDAEIFETLEFEFATLEQRLRETAFLTRGLRISITDERAEGHKSRVPLRGRHRRLRRLPEREQGPGPAQGHLLRGRERRGRRRGRDAVELLLPGVDLLLRQQHQHARGRLAPVRASARRSRARSTATRATRASSRRRTTTSPARTCARA